MSKAKKKASPKKPAEKKSEKPTKKTDSKKSVAQTVAAEKSGKSASKKKASAGAETTNEEIQEMDPDEAEELEDQALNARSAESAPNMSAAESSGSLKNFRQHPDIENFYRFIYENDLRFEALEIIDQLIVEKQKKKEAKGPSKTK